MKLEISNRLKEILKKYFNVDYDDFKVINMSKHTNFIFILKNKDDNYIRICFNYDQIVSIKVLDVVHEQIDFFASTGRNRVLFFDISGKVFVVKNCKMTDRIELTQKDCTIQDPSLVFLKLNDFEKLKKEINKKVFMWRSN